MKVHIYRESFRVIEVIRMNHVISGQLKLYIFSFTSRAITGKFHEPNETRQLSPQGSHSGRNPGKILKRSAALGISVISYPIVRVRSHHSPTMVSVCFISLDCLGNQFMYDRLTNRY